MADSLARLMRLLDQMEEGEAPPPPPPPRRNRNNRSRAPPYNNVRSSNHSPPPQLNNSGTQNMKGLINNTGYVEGNGNGSIVLGVVGNDKAVE
ncbi:unnamed protein product [Sphenostylis stenocarpa]|uniref:Uncharacterized protein n=1 Tax=Sphenostylis stenocarpa TaxID=92480 RepID=A0AA86TEA4_9FABA|nr:unnamed protein product [Sphenostylis stenocarpa]